MTADPFTNCYADDARAEAYASLQFANTYHLAFRDLPELFRTHARGRRALDFGCGAGRSTRFLRGCGFEVTGIDVSPQMLEKAKAIDPDGDYRLIAAEDFAAGHEGQFDLVQSAFTFDNVEAGAKESLLGALARVLVRGGVLVNVVSSPLIYVHEWASFSTAAFPENRQARSGDRVKIIVSDHGDGRPVEDIVCTDEAYRELYARAGLGVEAVHQPLATGQEPYDWVSETQIAAWTIYVLRRG